MISNIHYGISVVILVDKFSTVSTLYLHLWQLVSFGSIHHWDRFFSGQPLSISLVVEFFEDHFDGFSLHLPRLGRGN